MKMFKVKNVTELSAHLRRFFQQSRVKRNMYPVIDDLDCFLACDPTALYVGELDGVPIGSSCVFKYADGYRHGAEYFIEDEYRKQGYGLRIFDEAVKNSKPIETISAYAPFGMLELYKKYFGGIEVLDSVEVHDFNLIITLKKLEGLGSQYHIKDFSKINFKALLDYDKLTFGYDRPEFLKRWLHSPASLTSVAIDNGGCIVGYIVARESLIANGGYKIGALFSQDIDATIILMQSILEKIEKQHTCRSNSVRISVPLEQNPQSTELLKLLDGRCIRKMAFISSNGLPKGHFNKWFAVTF